MSRYKKVMHNEVEMKEIGGSKPILRISKDEKLKVIDVFFRQQQSGEFDVIASTKVLSEILFKSLFIWENNIRTNKKEEGTEKTTLEDVSAYVIDNVFEIWTETLFALDIVDEKKTIEMAKEKKEQETKIKENKSPN